MKIRNGFVSNSSSSSFMLYGIAVGNLDIEKIIGDGELEEGMDKKLKGTGLGYVNDWDNGTVYIGLGFEKMHIDETKRQFMDRAKKLLEELMGKEVTCELFDDIVIPC